jgi:hypothetical protein
MITPQEWQAFVGVVGRAPMTPLEAPTVQRIVDELAQLLQAAQLGPPPAQSEPASVSE